jgi:preprotein translocase subunit SecD
MLNFSLWKRIVIWGLVALGLFAAMPNGFYSRVDAHNEAITQIETSGETTDLAQARDGWPSYLPSALVNLGLDLRGGAHLLGEVEVAEVYATRIDGYWPNVRDALRAERETVGTIRRVDAPDGILRLRISQVEGMETALKTIRALATPVVSLTSAGQSDIAVSANNDVITIELSDAERAATDDRTMQQSLEIIRRRVDEVGTREPTIQRQGDDRILIQVPGIGSAAELKSLIGTTAKLTFHAVIGQTSNPDQAPGARNILIPDMSGNGVYYVLEATPVLTGDMLTDSQPAFDQNGAPAVTFRFNPAGARIFGDFSAANVNSPFAIVLDDEVISAPVINEAIRGGSGQISGNFTIEESTELSVLLRAGLRLAVAGRVCVPLFQRGAALTAARC